MGYRANISSLTGSQGSPIIQYVPPPLSLVDGFFVMQAAALEVKGSYALFERHHQEDAGMARKVAIGAPTAG